MGVQDLSSGGSDRKKRRTAGYGSADSNGQLNILIENNETQSGRKPKLFPSIEELGQIGKIKLPQLKTPQGMNGGSA